MGKLEISLSKQLFKNRFMFNILCKPVYDFMNIKILYRWYLVPVRYCFAHDFTVFPLFILAEILKNILIFINLYLQLIDLSFGKISKF